MNTKLSTIIMARICELTGVGVLFGNNVSHSNRKTRRVFLPNLQKKRFLSFKLGVYTTFRVTPKAMKTVDSKGGVDNYLLETSDQLLSKKAVKMKRNILNKKSV